MTPVSARFALPLLIAALLALVPVALNSYAGRSSDDCADPAGLLEPPEVPGSGPWRELEERHKSGVFQFTQASSRSKSLEAVLLKSVRVVRSLAPVSLVLMPAAITGSQSLTYQRELEWIEAAGEKIPIQVRRGRTDQVVSYMALLYAHRSRAVAHPLLESLASAPERLIRGARPLTLYWVTGSSPPAESEVLERRARRWLAKAWKRHLHVCSS